MSAVNIPFEIQEEILKRVLPVKSLLRFTSVSKQWKSLITSSKFIVDHSISHTHTQPHHILVKYAADNKFEYVFLVDDDSFPQCKFSPIVSPTDKLLRIALMLDCSHGLVCLHGLHVNNQNALIVLWNPSIRKSVGIALHDVPTNVGFGVCPKKGDPKIVKITYKTFIHQKAEVFTLSSRVWRSVPMNLPYKSIECLSNQVIIDGAIYWVALVKITNNECIRILSFDLTNEEFKDGDLPANLARGLQHPYSLEHINMHLTKLKESLVLKHCTRNDRKIVCSMWMILKNDAPNPSFTKLYTVEYDGLAFYMITGFRKTGQPMVEKMYKGSLVKELGVYDPFSKQFSGLGIYGWYFETTSYTESLLLLDYTDSIMY